MSTTSLLDDTLVDNLLCAISVGSGVEDYLAARRAGVCHGDIMDVLACTSSIDLLSSYAICVGGGVTHEEFLEVAARSESDFGSYLDGRKVGCSHDELLAVTRAQQCRLVDYVSYRGAGAEPAEAVECGELSINPLAYLRARDGGICHSEVIDAVRGGVMWVDIYVDWRDAGLSPTAAMMECLAGRRSGQ
jgi:hypothetical protein